MKPSAFLSTLWRRVAKDGDYVFMSFKKGKKGEKGYKWVDEVYQWNDGSVMPWVSSMLKRYAGWDVYFCPTPFTEPKRQSQFVKSTNLLWADIDDGDPSLLKPSILWKSGSKGHTQGIWFVNKTQKPIKTAQLNKGIAGFLGADPSGYDLSQVLRVPGTTNYKTKVGRPVTLVHWNDKTYTLTELAKYADKTATISEYENHKVPAKLDRTLLLKRLKKRPRLYARVTTDDCDDRSTQLYGVIPSLTTAGFSPEEIFWLLKGTYLGKHYKSDSKMIDDIHRTIKKTKANFKVKSKAKTKEKPDELFESVASLVSRDIPPPVWLVKGWLEFGPPAMVAGQAKAGKSTLLRELAASVASGSNFMNNPDYEVMRKGTVLFIQEEDSEGKVRDDIIKVLKAKGCGTDIPLYFMNMKGFKFDEEHMEKIEQAIEKHEPVLVIFDCLYRMIESGELNNADDMRDIQDWLATLSSEYETTPLLAHHYGKAKDADRSALKMLGSSTWHNFFRSGIFVSKDEESEIPEGCMQVFIERQFSNFGDLKSEFLIKLAPREYFEEGSMSNAELKGAIEEEFDGCDSLGFDELKDIGVGKDEKTIEDVMVGLGYIFKLKRFWKEFVLSEQTLRWFIIDYCREGRKPVPVSKVREFFGTKLEDLKPIVKASKVIFFNKTQNAKGMYASLFLKSAAYEEG